MFDYVFENLVFSTEAYNVNETLCCGHQRRERVLHKHHKDSVCCGDDQYNPETQGCCGDPPQINYLSVSCETVSDQALAQEPTGLSPSHYCMHTYVNKLKQKVPRHIVLTMTHFYSRQHAD